MPSKKGGRRSGAGRKRTVYKDLQARLESEKAQDAEYGLALFVAVLRDNKKPMRLRLFCAEKVMDRILGKPRESMKLSGVVGTEELSKLSADDRRKRIAELLERSGAIRVTPVVGSGDPRTATPKPD